MDYKGALNFTATPRTQPEPRFCWAMLLVLSLLAGCQHKKTQEPPPAPTVSVMTVSTTNVPIYQEWIGTLEGFVNAQIRAQVTGYLLSQDYAEGSEVKKGQLLFEIDPRPFEAALAQVQAKLAQNQAQLGKTELDVRRLRPLAQTKAVSQEELDNAVQSNLAAQAAVKADEAAIETAQLNLGFTRVLAPIDGLAGLAQAQIGDLVGPNGALLTTISKIDPIKVYFNVSEQTYLDYRRRHSNPAERATHEQELELQLILADGSSYAHPGKFLFAGREVNPTTGTLLLTGVFPNPALTLRPGQFARVRARTDIRQGVVLVPQRAVTELQASYQVAVVDQNNKAEIRPVKVGERIGSDWVIEEGLHAGDRLIVEGSQKVHSGLAVHPQPFVPPSTIAHPALAQAQSR